jgi:endonuclease/exonuclease/phosphatase (EEP) superfamily protein YafD
MTITGMSTFWSRLTALAYGWVALATLAAVAADRFWIFELVSHFRVQYVAVMLVLLAIFATTSRWVLAATLLPLLTLNILPVLPYMASEQPAAGPVGSVTLASINLWSRNDDSDSVLALLDAERPDVVVLQELTPDWASATAALAADYPYRVLRARPDNFGLALLSRYPIVRQRVIQLAGEAEPAIQATLQLGTRQLDVLGVHPVTPKSAELARRRNRQLAAIGELAAATPRPLAVLGDFNATPWSPHFRRLLEKAQLRDAARGRGLDFTWPTFVPLLGIPIDHCLVSDQVKVLKQWRGPFIGSDHYPLFTEIAI